MNTQISRLLPLPRLPQLPTGQASTVDRIPRNASGGRLLRSSALSVLLLSTMLGVTGQAWAQGHDAWGDRNCIKHGAGEFAAGLVSGALIENKPLAVAVALIPGLYRENWKAQHGFDSYSPSRLTWDLAGAVAGVYTQHWFVTRQNNQTLVEYRVLF